MREAMEGSGGRMSGDACGTLKVYDSKSAFVLDSRIVLLLRDPWCVCTLGELLGYCLPRRTRIMHHVELFPWFSYCSSPSAGAWLGNPTVGCHLNVLCCQPHLLQGWVTSQLSSSIAGLTTLNSAVCAAKQHPAHPALHSRSPSLLEIGEMSCNWLHDIASRLEQGWGKGFCQHLREKQSLEILSFLVHSPGLYDVF